jgi:hypothetical protein
MNNRPKKIISFFLVNIVLSFLFLATVFLLPDLIYRYYNELVLININWNNNNLFDPDSISFWLMLFMASISTGILTSLNIIWIRNLGYVFVLYVLANLCLLFSLTYFNLDKKLGIVLTIQDNTPSPSPIGLVILSVFILPSAVGIVVFVFIAFCYRLFSFLCPSFFTNQIDNTQETPSITTDERLQRGKERGQEAMEKRLQRAKKEDEEKKEFERLWWKAYHRFSGLSDEEKYRLAEEEMIYSDRDYANKKVGYRD